MSTKCEWVDVIMWIYTRFDFFSLFKNGRKNSKVRSKLLAWWWRTFQHFFIESLKSSDGERATNDGKKICEILLKHIFIACVIKAVFSPNHITIIIICASISPALDCYQYVGSYRMDHTHTSAHFDVFVRFFPRLKCIRESWHCMHAPNIIVISFRFSNFMCEKNGGCWKKKVPKSVLPSFTSWANVSVCMCANASLFGFYSFSVHFHLEFESRAAPFAMLGSICMLCMDVNSFCLGWLYQWRWH